MKAVVMAGGEGTRLRPLTSNQPKPMVPIFNKPIMQYIVELLKAHDITDIVVTLQFLPQLIKNYFGDGSDLGVDLIYAIEQSPLGTAGSVKNAEDHLNETFLVISGDALTDIDLQAVVDFHRRKRSLATIALKRVENPLEFGVVITDDEGAIQRFLEKPSWGEVFSDTINTGIYVLEPEIFNYIPTDRMVDFSKDVFPKVLEEGKPLFGYVTDGYWCDIGNYEQYMQAHQDLMQGKARIQPPGIKMREDVWIGEGAYIHPSADLRGPVVIGQNARIEQGAEVDEFSVIGNNVVMKDKAHTHRAVVWENTYLGPQSHLHGCVVGKNCDIKPNVRIDQGVVIGDECVIGEGAIINHDVKIYPFKRVDAHATVNHSIIWETRGMRTLFGKEGVSGLVGVDLTPDLAMRLAMAYGTSLKKDSVVIMSSDVSRASRMMKRAMISGLNSTGVHVRDMRVAPAAVNRFNVKTSRCLGGIHVRVSPLDPQSVQLNFFDAKGIDISEGHQRDIERYFYRGDFRRAYYQEIGEIQFPARGREYYADGILKGIDTAVIADRRFKIVVNYGFGGASLVLPSFAGRLQCNIVALNAFTDEQRITIAADELEQEIKQLEETVKLFKADLGILIDSAAEKVVLVDDQGRRLSHNRALLLFIDLMSKHEEAKGKIAVPVTVPMLADQVAAGHGRSVIRTKLSLRALMETADRRDVIFAGAQGGGFIFPRFLPAYDAMMTFCKLLELLAKEDRPLSELAARLPEAALAQKNTFCPWELKGLVMRKLIERSKGRNVELLDGVKVYEDNSWVLVLPDPEEPVFRVFAEAPSLKKARQDVDQLIKYIDSLVS